MIQILLQSIYLFYERDVNIFVKFKTTNNKLLVG